MAPEAVSRPGGELAAVRDALAWARPGDALLLTVHQDRPAVMALLERLRGEGWRAGEGCRRRGIVILSGAPVIPSAARDPLRRPGPRQRPGMCRQGPSLRSG